MDALFSRSNFSPVPLKNATRLLSVSRAHAGPLRNIALTAPYFHSGKVWDLKQAAAIMATSQLGEKLSDKEVDAITAFLRTLTGEQPRVELPILPANTDKTPLPK